MPAAWLWSCVCCCGSVAGSHSTLCNPTDCLAGSTASSASPGVCSDSSPLVSDISSSADSFSFCLCWTGKNVLAISCTTIYISLMPLNCTPKSGLDLMFDVFLAQFKKKAWQISYNILPLRKISHFPMDRWFMGRTRWDHGPAGETRMVDQSRMRRHLHLCWVVGTQQMRNRQATSHHTPPVLPGRTQRQPGRLTAGRMLLKASISCFLEKVRNFPSLLSPEFWPVHQMHSSLQSSFSELIESWMKKERKKQLYTWKDKSTKPSQPNLCWRPALLFKWASQVAQW